METWRNKVKQIFKEAEELDLEVSPSLGNEAPDGNDAGNAAPIDALGGSAPAPALGDGVPVATDEDDSKQPVTLTKGLLVQLLDLAANSAKEEEEEGNDAVVGDLGNELPVGNELPLGNDKKDKKLDVGPVDESRKAKLKEDGNDKKGNDDKGNDVGNAKPDFKSAVGNDDKGNAPKLGNDSQEAGNELDLGNSVGEVEDKPVNVVALVDKVLELAAGKEGGLPLDVDALETLKAAAFGSELGNELGNEIGNDGNNGNELGNEIGNDGNEVGNALGNGLPVGNDASKVEEKRKFKFT